MDSRILCVRDAVAILVVRAAVHSATEQELKFATEAIPLIANMLDSDVRIPVKRDVDCENRNE